MLFSFFFWTGVNKTYSTCSQTRGTVIIYLTIRPNWDTACKDVCFKSCTDDVCTRVCGWTTGYKCVCASGVCVRNCRWITVCWICKAKQMKYIAAQYMQRISFKSLFVLVYSSHFTNGPLCQYVSLVWPNGKQWRFYQQRHTLLFFTVGILSGTAEIW